MPEQKPAPDVVGFGALNIDYIASASKLSAKLTEPVAEWTARFDWNVETPVRNEIISRVIGQIGASSLAGSLGGSAWNVIFALAQMQVNLRLGYVGVVGRAEYPGLAFLTQMDSWGIDRRFVMQNQADSCGLCLSYIEDGERIMLTYPGANLGMASFIEENVEALAAYLASARFVHVTSFLDSRTPVAVLAVLSRAREIRPRMRIVFDPGHDWATHPSDAVRGILRLSDYLLLTYREFKALGEHGHGEPDVTVAARILAQCPVDAGIVVTKRYDVIEMFRARSGGVTGHRFIGAATDPNEEVEDTTGAGDAFAAGLLAGMASSTLQVELGASLGLSLARHTMRHRPFEGHSALPDVTRGFLRSDEHPHRTSSSSPAGVFIAHNDDPQWDVVHRFLEQECGVAVYSLSPGVRGEELADQMRRYLSRCGFAVCVLSASSGPSPDRLADHSVVHQAGILQGRYGFARVAMLVEKGCEMFSNVAGLIRFDFRPGHVETTFWQLERMLRREGLRPPSYG